MGHILSQKFVGTFIAWLNFTIGLDLCFYKGYQQIWLLYGFILHLIAVYVIVIVLCR